MISSQVIIFPDNDLMKEIVVFTEGVGELIFIRELLIRVIDNNELSFECLCLKGDYQLNYPYKFENPNAKINFLIINVGNDERVLSEILSRGPKYIERDVEIIGIRDIYSDQYKKYCKQINIDIINEIRTSSEILLQHIEGYERIHLIFAIMELEAWLLSFYKVFERISSDLSVENIRNQLNYDLENNDPEKTYFHPASIFSEILQLALIKYDKHQDDYEKFMSYVTVDDFQKAIDKNYCDSFYQLWKVIHQIHDESTCDGN